MAKIYASRSSEISKREIDHMNRIRKLTSQGMVLLANDGTLPLSDKSSKIALYGAGVRKTIKGGTGSGDVNSRTWVNVEQGFENAGFEVTSKGWLDAFDAQMENAHNEHFAKIRELAEKNNEPVFQVFFKNPFVAPEAKLITDADVKASDTDTAVYVIARISGEGKDRKVIEGDYLLGRDEREHIAFLAKSYSKFIVVLNVGGVIDTKFYSEIPGINALFLMSQAGNVSGDALVDALTGKVTPSGKLTTTWAENFGDYPSSRTFSHIDGNVDDEEYNEGIFVGYRYFDTFNVKPSFPFGYGLSYTTFDVKATDVKADQKEVSVTVKVTNTGAKFSGKEVVQVYYSAPSVKLEKPYQELAAYAKTKLLAPGESQTLVISFKTKDMASYSEDIASWVLEAGTYFIRVGVNSRQTHIAAALRLNKDAVTEVLSNRIKPVRSFELLSAKGVKPYSYAGADAEKAAAKVIDIDASKIGTFKAQYQGQKAVIPEKKTAKKLTTRDVFTGKATLDELVSQLTVEEMAELCCGAERGQFLGGFSVIGAASAAVPGAAGDTTSARIEDRDIRNMILSDGPAGLRLMQHFRADKDGNLIRGKAGFVAISGMDKLVKEEENPDAIDYYQYCTALPIATLLAQTWDCDLIKEIGDIVGSEMEEFGVTLWLAPGMNIHRNPLCGRNFEYYSEDPLISGMCAAADTAGVQSHAGIGTTLKHYAANNQEENRMYSDSHVTERTLREIYLKSFEIAVKTAQPMSIMTSYNVLNGTHTANNYDLINAVARDEWGFAGLVMTDWGTTGDLGAFMGAKGVNSEPSGCIFAGNDLIMPGSEKDMNSIIAAVDAAPGAVKFPISKADLQYCTKNIVNIVMKSNRYEGAKPYTGSFENLDWMIRVK